MFLGTDNVGIYELRNGSPTLVFADEQSHIHGPAFEPNDLYHATCGPRLVRLRGFRDRQIALDRPGEAFRHVAHASFPLSDEANEKSCTLVITLGGDARLSSAYFPVLRGPSLYWNARDWSAQGGRLDAHRFEYHAERGTYWVRMETKADIPKAPVPAGRRVFCGAAQARASFRF